MAYFLSYVEFGEHAGLMLAEQKDPIEPAKIICEVGFGYSPDISTNRVGLFGRYKGHIHLEDTASRALYSSLTVSHRTYEISHSEMEHFFNIVNSKRRVKASPVKIGKTGNVTAIIGGPDYQRILSNCKVFALGVMKEIGIMDAKQLSNFFIQRPGTTNHLLKKISKTELSCPRKEEFILKTNLWTKKLMKNLQAMRERLKEKSINMNKRLYSHLKNTLESAEKIKSVAHKVGIDRNFKSNFEELGDSLNQLLEYIESPAFRAGQSENDQLAARIRKDVNQYQILQESANNIDKLSDQDELEFYWKHTPPVSRRLSLANFNENEKIQYLLKIQTHELEDGLNQILMEIDHAIHNKSKHWSEDALTDLKLIKDIVKGHKDSIGESNFSFYTSHQNRNDYLEASLKHQEKLNKVIADIKTDLADIELRSPKETSVFIRFINTVLSYVSKAFLGLGAPAKSIINRKLDSLDQHVSQHHYHRRN